MIKITKTLTYSVVLPQKMWEGLNTLDEIREFEVECDVAGFVEGISENATLTVVVEEADAF